MKRTLLSLILSMLIISSLTGCGTEKQDDTKKNEDNIITCTRSNSDDFSEEKETGIIEYKNDKVISVERISLYKIKSEDISDEEFNSLFNDLSETATVYKKIDGCTYNINSDGEKKEITISVKLDYTKINLDQVKETIGEDYINETFPNGLDITVDQVKTSQFEGFECK